MKLNVPSDSHCEKKGSVVIVPGFEFQSGDFDPCEILSPRFFQEMGENFAKHKLTSPMMLIQAKGRAWTLVAENATGFPVENWECIAPALNWIIRQYNDIPPARNALIGSWMKITGLKTAFKVALRSRKIIRPTGLRLVSHRSADISAVYKRVKASLNVTEVDLSNAFIREVLDDALSIYEHCWVPNKIGFNHYYYGFWQELYFDTIIAEALIDNGRADILKAGIEHHLNSNPHLCFSAHLASKLDVIPKWQMAKIPQLTIRKNQQNPDGSWPYEVPKNRIENPEGKVAIGQMAVILKDFIDYSMITSDPQFLNTIVLGLNYILQNGCCPVGGQTWEIHIKTPDLLAAANLSQVFIKAYQLFEEPKYLKAAQVWAYRGVPFIYLWNLPELEIMEFSAVPCFGVTRQQDTEGEWVGYYEEDKLAWWGVSCPWVALAYAEALLDLVHCRRDPFLQNIAAGILKTAMKTRKLSPINPKLIPDAFDIGSQTIPYPMWIVPRNLASLAMKFLALTTNQKSDTTLQKTSMDLRVDDVLLNSESAQPEPEFNLSVATQVRCIPCAGKPAQIQNDLEYPEHAYIDLTGRCNISCIICPHAYEDFPRSRHPMMSDVVIEKIKRSIYPHARAITFSGSGESLLHPRCRDLFVEAQQYSFLPTMIHNGTLLKDDFQRLFVETGTYLRISFDGATRETFEKIRVGADYEQVLKGIQQTLKINESVQDERFCIRFDTTVHKLNIEELPEIVNLAGRMGVHQVFVHHLYTDNIPLKDYSLDHLPELCDEMLMKAMEAAVENQIFLAIPAPFTQDPDYHRQLHALRSRIPGNRMEKYSPASFGPDSCYPCRVPFKEMLIKPDGNVSFCCLLQEEYPMGNLETQEFEEIWFGEKYEQLRKHVNTPDPLSLCHPRKCKIRNTFWTGQKILEQQNQLIFTSQYPNSLRYKMEIMNQYYDAEKGIMNMDLAIVNEGDTIWYSMHADPGAAMHGKVNVGIQRFSADYECLERDFYRSLIPGNFHPGMGMVTPVEFPWREEFRGQKFMLDLLVEGIVWFSDTGQEPIWVEIS